MSNLNISKPMKSERPNMAQEHWMCDENDPNSPNVIYREYLQYYPYLVNVPVRFVFKEKAKREEERPTLGKVSKLSPVVQALLHVEGEEDPVFLFLIGYDAWLEADRAVKEAWMDFLMAHCVCEENEDDGSLKCKVRAPSIKAFPEILSRHGTNWDSEVNKLSVMDLSANP